MFPNFAKLHMMLIQVYVHFQDVEAARQAYNKAVTLCPKSVQLWIVAAHMEQAVCALFYYLPCFFTNACLQAGSFTRARSVLERARHAIEANPLLWLETIRNEANAGEERLALTRMSQVLTSVSLIAAFLIFFVSQALQECPHSGLLWAEAIFLEQRNKRKARSIDAIKACENDPMVMLSLSSFICS
jgi:pre-mRNA-processing factor 6